MRPLLSRLPAQSPPVPPASAPGADRGGSCSPERFDELKRQAWARNIRYTSYVRSILERAAQGGLPPDMAEITKRLERIERAVTSGHAHDDQKTA